MGAGAIFGTVLGVAGIATGAARAEPARPPTVEELVVTAPRSIAELTVTAKLKCAPADRMGGSGERPNVVSSYPARGAVVRPGLIVLRVTFDRPMACTGRLVPLAPWASPCPAGPQEMLLSYDRRTVRTACAAAPGGRYGLALNPDLTRGDLFMGVAGLPAQARTLEFTTSAGPPVTSVCEALAQDAETAHQLATAHRTLDCAAAAPGE